MPRLHCKRLHIRLHLPLAWHTCALDHTTKASPSSGVSAKPEFQYQARNGRHVLGWEAWGCGCCQFRLLSLCWPGLLVGKVQAPAASLCPGTGGSSLAAPSLGAQAPPGPPAPVFAFSLTRLSGDLSFSAGYLRYPAALNWCSVKTVQFKCSFDVFVGGVDSAFFCLQSPPSRFK